MATLKKLSDKFAQLFLHPSSVITTSAEGDYAIKLRKCNQLLNLIGIEHITQVKRLTLTGEINGTDLAVIKKMKQLEYLDIQHAQIIPAPTSIFPLHKNRIGKHFFLGNQQLQSLLLPDSITEIADSAFAGCYNLTHIHLPQKLILIGSQAFTQTGITEISIPNTVTHIGENAFLQCRQLQTLRFEDGGQSMEWTGLGFAGCPISHLYIGRNLNDDDFCEFENPSTLQQVTIGSAVSQVNIYLGENLKELICLCPTPPSGNFQIPEHCVIKIPSAYYRNYWIHPVWGEMNLKVME